MESNAVALTKAISPTQHALIDYSVASTFFTLSVRYRGRNDRAAALAFLSGGLVLGVSLLTDYPGGLWRRISFKTHGILDVVQAGITALGPVLFDFAGTPEAKTFYAQAASEVGVVALTDWNAMTS